MSSICKTGKNIKLAWVKMGLRASLFLVTAALGLAAGCATAPSRRVAVSHAFFLKHPLTPLDYAIRKPLKEYLDNISLGEKAIEVMPGDAKGYSILGGAYYYIWRYYSGNRTDLEKSMAASEKNIEVAPDDYFPRLTLSMAYCDLGRHSEEIVQLEKAISIKPDDIGFHLYRAGALREVGREDEALKEDAVINTLRVGNRHLSIPIAAGSACD